MNLENQKSKSNKTTWLILSFIVFIFLMLGVFILFLYNQNKDTLSLDSKIPKPEDIEISEEYVKQRVGQIKMPGDIILNDTYNQGCVKSPGGSGFVSETDTRCTYRNLTLYLVSGDADAFLSQLKEKIKMDGWVGNGEDTKTYNRYDGPVEKSYNVDLHIKIYKKGSLSSVRSSDYDIFYEDNEDKHMAALFDMIKKELTSNPESTYVVIDLQYVYFWSLD
ncbi:hypothetical protein H6800_03130 [Candidatus Nomurabacteria bacterium]|nr:hypothetical protein [Candidatus Nomurabacteria bacterium]